MESGDLDAVLDALVVLDVSGMELGLVVLVSSHIGEIVRRSREDDIVRNEHGALLDQAVLLQQLQIAEIFALDVINEDEVECSAIVEVRRALLLQLGNHLVGGAREEGDFIDQAGVRDNAASNILKQMKFIIRFNILRK